MTLMFGKSLKEFSDEEIMNQLDHSSPTMTGPLSTELLIRNIKRLNVSIDSFRQSSDKYSKRIYCLTIILIILTLILALPILRGMV